MRIIAGQWRSRRLERPDSDATRPVPDRVRQSIFDIVTGLYGDPGALPALDVADAFAGGGSMGLEALSRGARSCVFFEIDREALQTLRVNLEALGAEDRSRVVTFDAWQGAVVSHQHRPFDLIFLDPPYADSDDVHEAGRVRQFLADLARPFAGAPSRPSAEAVLQCAEAEGTPVTEDGGLGPLLVLHHRGTVHFQLPAGDDWMVIDRREIGSNAVTYFRRAIPATMQPHVQSDD